MQLELVVARSRLTVRSPIVKMDSCAGGREREEEEDLVYSVCRSITYSLFVDVDIK